MSTQAKGNRFSDKIAPGSIKKDELDDYIRYQDDVLDRNAEELKGVLEDQEKEIEERQEFEAERTDSFYLKKDPLEPLDEKIRANLQRIDSNIAARSNLLDKKTDEYMGDLAKRNAEWNNRLKAVGTTLTQSSRLKGSASWNERMEQKRVNRDYQSTYTDAATVEVWDDDQDIILDENVPGDQKIEEAIEIEAESRPQQTSQRPGKGKSVQYQGSQKQRDRQAVRTQNEKRIQDQERAKRKERSKPRYTTSTSTTQQQTRKEVPTARARTATATTTTATHKTYPCPGCQKPLIYYDKYKRWWCRSCKKWR